jgi:predicted nucleotidyltransferase
MLALVTDKQTELAEACRMHHVRLLEVFGSAARNDFDHDTSDLDFLVEFEPLASGQFDAYFGLKEDLETLFGRPVDLVVAHAVRNRYFLESINRHREVVYGP